MKKIIILLAISLSVCSLKAQLKVLADGSLRGGSSTGVVRINTGNGYVDIGPQNTTACQINTDRAGFSFNKSISFNGQLTATSTFYLYQTGQTYPTIQVVASTGKMGVMMGPVGPAYTLDVNGLIHGTNVSVTSDSTLKKDIKDFPASRIANLYSVKAKTYKLKSSGNKSKTSSNGTTDDNKDLIGLLAQEIRNYYPELVYQDSLGILSLNYEGLIPVIIEALKKQNSDIQTLNTKVSKLESKPKSAESYSGNGLREAQLFQNNPNPFTENTSIEFYLPTTVQKAVMYIYDLQGKQIKSIPVIQRESGNIVINGSELMPGMYIYSIIADGKIIGTQQMVLTD